MFKVGDIVEITDESDSTGMLDFKKGKGYRVEKLSYCEDNSTGKPCRKDEWLNLTNESGVTDWYTASHFKLKEDIKVEKKECLFKEGQVVWDLRNGRGVVEEIVNNELYPVKVKFDLKDMDGDDITDYYMTDGRYVKTQTIRSLYFSEPKIEAATEPMFEPTLKEGDVVIALDAEEYRVIYIKAEEYDRLVDYNGSSFCKIDWEFYTLGEKINFK